MNRIIYAILATLVMVSCSKNYNITGTSDYSQLDGNRLYLRVVANGDAKNIDSCEVVHGQFHFSGSFDSIQVASICTDNEISIPVVLEEGDIVVTLNSTDVSCKGTELNDTLNSFLKNYEKLINERIDVEKNRSHAEYMFYTDELDDPAAMIQKLNEDEMRLDKAIDDLFTNFVVKNFENILGPYIFLYKAAMEGGGFYQLTPWMEAILSKAPDGFKENAEVKEYVENAQRNKNIENGTEMPVQAPIQGAVQASVPTPSEMEKPEQ